MKTTGTEKIGTKLTLWPHTGIEAPFKFTSRNYKGMETSRGVAYTADLVHPELGVVGTVENRGDGGGTWFYHSDRKVFSQQDFAQFAAQCREDGEPLHEAVAVEHVLDMVIEETETEELVRTMRARGGVLVRTYEPRTETNYGPYRGAALLYKTIAWAPQDRAERVKRLNENPDTRARDGAHWQMFNGRSWVPLSTESKATPNPLSDRIKEMVAAYDAVKPASSTTRVQGAGPLADGLYVNGSPVDAEWVLTEQPGIDRSDEWCRCRVANPAAVRFEKWNIWQGLIGTGTLHASKNCRRLLVID
ncbi:hypothetical protein SUDANB95_07867 (plasmid) [Actinosynnema sp. ALI-1.44]